MSLPRGYNYLPLLLCMCICCLALGQTAELPKRPPGRFFPLKATDHGDAATFKTGQPIVGTTYFYWYDLETSAHIIDHDGTDALTTHPADMNNISYKRASWHRAQLEDMVAAGVDFLMPVFWGVPGKYDGWSFAGLPPLVNAHNALEKEGITPPAIGMFYDTSILKHNRFGKDGANYHVDLATDFGKEWFYTPIRDFFSLIPPPKWARVDGRPIVFVYASAFAKGQDEKQFDYVKRRFDADFGIEPFIVKSSGWKGLTDATYSWGGAVSGPLIYRQVAALGPGYDHTAVPGRQPLIVERRDGQTYIDRWLKILQLDPRHRPWIVHVETWNEWHEGTDIAHSREYGRSYIVLTRLFADIWRAKTVLKIHSLYPDANTVAWAPGRAEGLGLRPSDGDGVWRMKKFSDAQAVVSDANPYSSDSRYLYFNVDDAFAFGLFDRTIMVSVSYRDAGCASFHIEYDNTDPGKGALEGAFHRIGNVAVKSTGSWKTADFELAQCRFMNRCNSADLRIAVLGGDLELAINKVELRRSETTGDKE
ncbi:MAG: hypothetical protein CEE38_14145 [Planctomycetes bacterium B3_Pla]|nr:MAG: hypothetical protein CEE38_14145 [Planctomycetes bacterium B3_Pla]